jgi:hypothetical protein
VVKPHTVGDDLDRVPVPLVRRRPALHGHPSTRTTRRSSHAISQRDSAHFACQSPQCAQPGTRLRAQPWDLLMATGWNGRGPQGRGIQTNEASRLTGPGSVAISTRPAMIPRREESSAT